MPDERPLPDRPLDFIRRCVREHKILWTYHANMRLRRRFIERDTILEAFESFEIIESYPDDKYFPSYLVLGRTEGTVFHALFAADVEGDNVCLVTAYLPDPRDWEQDLRTRRKP